MLAFSTVRERNAHILNQKEKLRLNQILTNLEHSKELEEKALEQFSQVFRIRSSKRLQRMSCAIYRSKSTDNLWIDGAAQCVKHDLNITDATSRSSNITPLARFKNAATSVMMTNAKFNKREGLFNNVIIASSKRSTTNENIYATRPLAQRQVPVNMVAFSNNRDENSYFYRQSTATDHSLFVRRANKAASEAESKVDQKKHDEPILDDEIIIEKVSASQKMELRKSIVKSAPSKIRTRCDLQSTEINRKVDPQFDRKERPIRPFSSISKPSPQSDMKKISNISVYYSGKEKKLPITRHVHDNTVRMVEQEREAFNSKERDVHLFYRKARRLTASAKTESKWSFLSITRALLAEK